MLEVRSITAFESFFSHQEVVKHSGVEFHPQERLVQDWRRFHGE
jgi:hypothetical protein